MDLCSSWSIRDHRIARRIVFGPHVTNLGTDRAFSERHVAYYERRARGGVGLLITEEVAVDEDWPYERSPHAASAEVGWHAIVQACSPHGTTVLAALGHTGLQGSSAYSQRALLAPSAVPDPVTREVPAVATLDELARIRDAFANAAAAAIASGCSGVELNFGQQSLLRQFLSGLTNTRADEYGPDGPHGRFTYPREVLLAVRAAIGPVPILAVRLCVDELAPWAGITLEQAGPLLASLSELCDVITPVRGSIFSRAATRPDGHESPGFMRDALIALAPHCSPTCAIIWQGSNVDVDTVAAEIDSTGAMAVEMTRALIADPDLPNKVNDQTPQQIRPCTLCNQRCQVQDARNPVVSCQVNPEAGYELEFASVSALPPSKSLQITVIGAGVAGLEAARIASERGHTVRIEERTDEACGVARLQSALPGFGRTKQFLDWLRSSVEALGVPIEYGSEYLPADQETAAAHSKLIIATGGIPGDSIPGTLPTFDAVAFLEDPELLDTQGIAPGAPVVIWDSIGGPIAIGIAELLAANHPVTFVHPDPVAGSQLAMSGDLAPASTRLAQAGVTLIPRAVVQHTTDTHVYALQRITAVSIVLPAAALITVTTRLPNTTIDPHEHLPQIGDRVAPRTIGDALRDAHRSIYALEQSS